MSVTAALIALAVGFGGVLVGARLTRRNDRRSHSDALLADALNDAVAAISEVAGGGAKAAQSHYAAAVSRIALHAPPEVARAWCHFQQDATTETDDGRARLVAAVQRARAQLAHGAVSDDELRVLLFGPGRPRR